MRGRPPGSPHAGRSCYPLGVSSPHDSSTTDPNEGTPDPGRGGAAADTTRPTGPAGRYPTQRGQVKPGLVSTQTRKILRIGFVATLTVGVGVAWVGFQKFGDPDVSGEIAGYELIDSSTVEVHIAVTRANPHEAVSCIVRARSRDGDETGRREILVPASDQSTVDVFALVRTSDVAAMGDVYGCGDDVPEYLVPDPASR